MTDGIKLSESPEVPPESREVAEAKQELDQATIEPEAAIEIGDPKPAELLQEAFVAVVPPVQEQVTPPAPQESAPETGQDSGGKSGFGNQNTNPADHYSGVNMTQGEVLEDNDWNEDGSDPNTVETYTPSLNENQPTTAEHIEGQSEAVEGASADLKGANSTVDEMLEEVIDELQEASGQEQSDNTSNQREVSEVSSASDLPAPGQEDSVDMENYFEPERTSLEAKAQAMQSESEDIKENIEQDLTQETLGTSTDIPQDRSSTLIQQKESLQEIGASAAADPKLTGSGTPPASGLETEDEESSADGTDVEGVVNAVVEKLQDSYEGLSSKVEHVGDAEEDHAESEALGIESIGTISFTEVASDKGYKSDSGVTIVHESSEGQVDLVGSILVGIDESITVINGDIDANETKSIGKLDETQRIFQDNSGINETSSNQVFINDLITGISDNPEDPLVIIKKAVDSLNENNNQIDFDSLDDHDSDTIDYVSGEFGDPDDLNPARERPDESPEGKAKDAVAEAQEKAAKAEEARQAAERAKAKGQQAIEDLGTPKEDFESKYSSAQDAYSALMDSLSEEGNPDGGLHSADNSSRSIEDESEETQSLYDEYMKAYNDLLAAASEYKDAIDAALEARNEANNLAEQAARAEMEAEKAAAAARSAVAEATGETQNDRRGTNDPEATDDKEIINQTSSVGDPVLKEPSPSHDYIEGLITETDDKPEDTLAFVKQAVDSLRLGGFTANYNSLDEHDSDVMDYVSGEFGDPDDLNPARDRPDESTEGKANDAVAEAQEKAAEAEKAEEAAKRAAAETQKAIEEAKTAQEILEDSIESTQEIYAALLDALTDEGKYFFQAGVTEYTAPEPDPDAVHAYTDLPPATSWSMEDESEEAQALYAKLETALEELKQAASDYQSAGEEAVESKTKSDDLADQAARAATEAEKAAAIASAAVAEATGEYRNNN